MKLKDLEGKKAIRTRSLKWTNTEYSMLNGVTKIPKEDRSYMGREIEILKITEGLAYFSDKSGYSERIDTLSLYEYDDGFWEESLISTFTKKDIKNV